MGPTPQRVKGAYSVGTAPAAWADSLYAENDSSVDGRIGVTLNDNRRECSTICSGKTRGAAVLMLG